MKVVVVGKNGFLARHIIAAAQAEGLAVTAISHDQVSAAAFVGAGQVVNCATPPSVRSTPYQVQEDFDLRIAGLAAKAGAGFTMLSTRRVYPAGARWDAREEAAATGDESLYGVNKACSEAAVRASGARHAIFRLSNVFGAEYGRFNFLGLLLTSLKDSGTIHFDMSPNTRRDFIPVETAAAVIARQLKRGNEGVFNLGCGFPVACGDVANWVLEGFGSGRLAVSDDTVRDEFFVNVDKTAASFAAGITPDELRQRFIRLGQDLRES